METTSPTGESGSSSTLQSGQSMKPNLSLGKAQQLLEEHYGLKVESIKELNSYDDNNFFVRGTTIDGQTGNFTFKVLNSMVSKSSDHIEAEHVVMRHLHNNGINCPTPLQNREGKTFSLVIIKNDGIGDVDNDGKPLETSHLISLLNFVEGLIMHQVPPTPKLLEKAGKYIARVDDLLQSMSSLSALTNFQSLWSLSSFLELEKFTFVLEGHPQKLSLVSEVLAAYKNQVLPKLPHLPSGAIHGDFNEQNIIVQPSPTEPGEYDVHGLIDFADLQTRPYVFELAVLVCYLMLECTKEGVNLDPFEGAQNVIKGYCTVRKVEDVELEVLRILVACRFCISLVMGAHTYSLDPGNEYLLITAKTGWTVLERVWKEKSDDDMMACWKAQIKHVEKL